jgi:hypothetical protein
MDLKEISYDGMTTIHFSQERNRQQVHINADCDVTDLTACVPLKEANT